MGANQSGKIDKTFYGEEGKSSTKHKLYSRNLNVKLLNLTNRMRFLYRLLELTPRTFNPLETTYCKILAGSIFLVGVDILNVLFDIKTEYFL